MSKTITLRLKDEIYQEFSEAALSESRSVSNLIQIAALAKIREQQFADDAEMNEIVSDKELMQRIKTGSREARLRKGRFVD